MILYRNFDFFHNQVELILSFPLILPFLKSDKKWGNAKGKATKNPTVENRPPLPPLRAIFKIVFAHNDVSLHTYLMH